MALTPRERLHLQNVIEQIALAEKAAEALRYSYQRVSEIGTAKEFDEADWERWDALTARFARLADILTQRVFRAIDVAEFLPPASTFLDRIHRAEKRGLVRSADLWKEIREIRNQIVHEYATEDLLALLEDVLQYTPEPLEGVERLKTYQGKVKRRLESG